jgi:hypothetical protein
MARVRLSLYKVIGEAVADFAAHGYDNEERLTKWLKLIQQAARDTLVSDEVLLDQLRRYLGGIYRRLVVNNGVLQYHPGVAKYTLARLTPSMRRELDRRILSSASLIKLNREDAIQKTLRRFAGWATAIPKGGSETTEKGETAKDVRKALSQLSFVERRVCIDQGHKLTAAISNVVATENGAIAVIWHSRWRQAGYDYREEHRERDGLVYLIRDSWATSQGLVKAGKAGYYEDVTAVGEEVYCRCYAQYIYSLRKLPKEMLTKKGMEKLREAS